jgi:hypothetical protein
VAKRQTRRTISFNAKLHALIQQAAACAGVTASQWMSDIARARLLRFDPDVVLPEQHHFLRRRPKV